MRINKILSTLTVTAVTAVSVCVSATATGYYNAIAEAEQIRSFINRGLYLEAIRDSENTIAWHNLSPEDVTVFSNFKSEAEQKYNDYVNGVQKSYYNASAEVNQIHSFINQGLYYEAIAECEQTIAWHELSSADIDLINGLKSSAQSALNKYNNSRAISNYTTNVPIPQSDDSDYYSLDYWSGLVSGYSDRLGIWHDNSSNPAIEMDVQSINDEQAVISVYRIRGKDVQYSISTAQFSSSNIAYATGYESFDGYYSNVSFTFTFNGNNVVMKESFSDGTENTTVFVR